MCLRVVVIPLLLIGLGTSARATADSPPAPSAASDFARRVAAAQASAPDTRAATKQILDIIQHETDMIAIVSQPFAAANHALDRARNAADAGNRKHAQLLGSVALGWAITARDLVIAAKLEAELASVQRKLADTRTQTERERALLEETLSRRGRATVELERIKEEASPSASATTQHKAKTPSSAREGASSSPQEPTPAKRSSPEGANP